MARKTWRKSFHLYIAMLMERTIGSHTSWLETKGQTRIKVGKLPTWSREIPINNLLTANQPGGVWDHARDPFVADPTTHATLILLHIRDPISGAQFLIDTGAEVSIIPPTFKDRSRPPTTTNLVAANGS